MQDNPACPVCGADDWEPIGQRTYAAAAPSLGDHGAARFRVLFELWLPGQAEVTLTSNLCRRCGFVLYTPRPSEADLDAKYRFLNSLPSEKASPEPDPRVVRRRAAMLFRLVRCSLGKDHPRVLDYGGGDGRLVAPLAARGCRCFLVDYGSRVAAGVTRLGTTLADVGEGQTFDLIVSNHVLEHLANPLEVVAGLRRLLAADGTLFVEVPLEVWLEAPLFAEPVTHVNFFTEDSLRHLLSRAGLRVTRCKLGRFVAPRGQHGCCVRAWATPGGNPAADPPAHAADATRRLLSPGAKTYLKILRAYPPRVIHYFWNRLFSR